MKCANCGNEIPENSKFCNNCGSKVEAPEAAPATAPVEENAPAPAVELEDAPLFWDNGKSLVEEKASAVAVESVEPEMPVGAPEIVEMPPVEEREVPKLETAPLHTCANCGASLNPDAKFCKSCGSAVAPAPAPAAEPKAVVATCANCGAPLKPDAKFCNNCGSVTAAEAADIKPSKKKKSKKPIIIISIILALLLLFGGTFAALHFTGALDDFYEAIGIGVDADDDDDDSDKGDDKDSKKKDSDELDAEEVEEEKVLPDPTETISAFSYAMNQADFDGMKLYVKDESNVDALKTFMTASIKEGMATGMGIADIDSVAPVEFLDKLTDLVFTSVIKVDSVSHEIKDEEASVTVRMSVKDMTSVDMNAMSQEFTSALAADTSKLTLFQEKSVGLTTQEEMYKVFLEIYGEDFLNLFAKYVEAVPYTDTEDTWTLEYIDDKWLITDMGI